MEVLCLLILDHEIENLKKYLKIEDVASRTEENTEKWARASCPPRLSCAANQV